MGSCVFQIPSEETVASSPLFDCAVYATRGARSNMEDNHVISLSLPNHPSYSLFGVFDGFNGDDASKYLSQNIVDQFNKLTDLEDNSAIVNALHQMDSRYIHSDDNQSYNTNAGCTLVFALVHADSIYEHSITNIHSSHTESVCTPMSTASRHESEPFKFGSFDEAPTDIDHEVCGAEKGYRVRVFWAGDSRATLMMPDCGQFQRLTFDHHAKVQKEAERIVNAKGTIANGRVDGICEVTRCFGCRQMKSNTDLPANKQKMIVEPECTTVVCRKDDQLLIFCDGLVKKWTDNELYVRYKHHLLQHKDENDGLLYASKYLCEQAIDEGSKDNITLLALKFN